MATADLQAIQRMLEPHHFVDSIFGFHSLTVNER